MLSRKHSLKAEQFQMLGSLLFNLTLLQYSSIGWALQPILTAPWTRPSQDYQAGLLLFPVRFLLKWQEAFLNLSMWTLKWGWQMNGSQSDLKSHDRSTKGGIPLMRILLKFIRRNFSTVTIYQSKVSEKLSSFLFQGWLRSAKYNHLFLSSGMLLHTLDGYSYKAII